MQPIDFWGSVSKAAPDACWPWRPRTDGRHHQTRDPRTRQNDYAHRIALSLHLGRPLKACALHRCDNPPCCNPAHLFEGTQADNMRDMWKKRRNYTGGPGVNVARGERSGHAKLTEVEVRAIRRACTNELRKDVAARFGVSPATINDIFWRKTWAHVK